MRRSIASPRPLARRRSRFPSSNVVPWSSCWRGPRWALRLKIWRARVLGELLVPRTGLAAGRLDGLLVAERKLPPPGEVSKVGRANVEFPMHSHAQKLGERSKIRRLSGSASRPREKSCRFQKAKAYLLTARRDGFSICRCRRLSPPMRALRRGASLSHHSISERSHVRRSARRTFRTRRTR